MYLVPDGVGTLLFPHQNEKGGDIYLSITQNTDFLLLTSSGNEEASRNYIFSVKKACQWLPADQCVCQAVWLTVDFEPMAE